MILQFNILRTKKKEKKMDLIITELNSLHIEELLSLMEQFYQFEDIPFDPINQKSLLQQIFDNKNFGIIYGLKYDNSLIGYSVVTKGFSLEYQGQYLLIDELFILPNYRSKGYATKFLTYLKNFAKQNKISYILLEVDDFNNKAYQLYIKNGFVDKKRNLLRLKT